MMQHSSFEVIFANIINISGNIHDDRRRLEAASVVLSTSMTLTIIWRMMIRAEQIQDFDSLLGVAERRCLGTCRVAVVRKTTKMSNSLPAVSSTP